MNIVFAMGIGFVLDCILGDPHCLPHPVRWIGGLILRLDEKLHLRRALSCRQQLACGAVLVGAVCAVTGITVALIRTSACHISGILGVITDGVLFYYCIAPRSLCRESMAVCQALDICSRSAETGTTALGAERCGTEENGAPPTDHLQEARRRLSMIVGRDTECLTEEGIIKAAIETVAENTSDGVTAPVLYMALGGPVLCFLYKAVNTMDSMVGYHSDTYEYFGKAAARTDDVWNYIPSRLTAWIMIFTAMLFELSEKCKNSYNIFRRNCNGNCTKNSKNNRENINNYQTKNKTYDLKTDSDDICPEVNDPATSNGARNLTCHKGRDIDPRGIRQLSVQARPLDSLPAGINWRRGVKIYRRDRRCHKSPNSGQTESVCAGVLGVRLAGDASYFGKTVHKPYIGDPVRKAERGDIRRACLLMYGTAIITLLLAAALRILYYLK